MNAHIIEIENFFQHIINDIKNNSQLLAGIEYLYQRNSTLQAESIRSGAKIRVQPALV